MFSGIFNIFWPFAVCLLSCSEATIHKTDSMLLPLHVCITSGMGPHICAQEDIPWRVSCLKFRSTPPNWCILES